ncbi:hypothetical protein HMPREF1129_0199 [Actinomyces naeslundii str. Howell 279]|uniref:Uncharacterized protein n=1 Tax=Actinomyces naeslundii (strain ATCC 12104 / DSM 43013 / CCUG 2238 / JCM 8349 / NCTC 10301 / Howell 279) TaxID=1115803 RepID=J3JKT0_ACTNH|nr:hypothetical protein HMPREF1129_0199 [Actinomyces naeslundii str. Howell 279]
MCGCRCHAAMVPRAAKPARENAPAGSSVRTYVMSSVVPSGAAWRTPRLAVTANVCSCGRLEHR